MERRPSLTVILLRVLAIFSFFAIPIGVARLQIFMPGRGVLGLAGGSMLGLLALAQMVKRNQDSVDDQLDRDAQAKATGDPSAGDWEMRRYEDQAAKKLRRSR